MLTIEQRIDRLELALLRLTGAQFSRPPAYLDTHPELAQIVDEIVRERLKEPDA